MAWYLGNDLDLSEQLTFYASAFLSSFVAPIIGIPFLLDIMKIPADMMELFVMSTVYTDRIRVVLGAVHQRKKFTDMNIVQARKDLRLGIVQSDPAFSRWVQTGLPNATIVDIKSAQAFLRGQQPDVDAVVYSAEGGSGWTLIYPDYSIIVPANLNVKVPMAYPTPKGDGEWTRFVSTWVDMKIKNGTVDRLFEHWIGGAGAVPKEPRWSVIRDVLHWVE